MPLEETETRQRRGRCRTRSISPSFTLYKRGRSLLSPCSRNLPHDNLRCRAQGKHHGGKPSSSRPAGAALSTRRSGASREGEKSFVSHVWDLIFVAIQGRSPPALRVAG